MQKIFLILIVGSAFINFEVHFQNSSVKEANGTRLHFAAQIGHEDFVKFFMDLNFPVNATTATGLTPIIYAAVNGYPKIVELLVDAGGDANIRTCSSGLSALHLVMHTGNLIVMKTLLSKNANVNSKAKNGITPLMTAVYRNQTEMVKQLIASGCDVSLRAKGGTTALHLAMNLKNVDIVQELLPAYRNDSAKRQDMSYALEYAIHAGNEELVNVVIDNGADINTILDSGLTPLMRAVVEKKTDMVRLLIKRGSDVNIPYKQSTPLIQAAMQGSLHIVSLILGVKGSKRVDKMKNANALHAAAHSGSQAIGLLLINAGFDVNHRTKVYLLTPLHAAAAAGHKDFVLMLLAVNADCWLTDNIGSTPFYHAIVRKKAEVANILNHYGCGVTLTLAPTYFIYEEEDVISTSQGVVFHGGEEDVNVHVTE